MKRTSRLVTTLAVLLVAAGVVWMGLTNRQSHKSDRRIEAASSMSNLSVLLSTPPGTLGQVDIARMNLLCAQGLPGAEDLDVNSSLAMLDQMAARVRAETERHFYRFQQNPGEFENSEGFFRMLMLAVVLTEDFQVHYAPDKIGTAGVQHFDLHHRGARSTQPFPRSQDFGLPV